MRKGNLDYRGLKALVEHDGDQEHPAQYGNGSKHAVDPEAGQERDHGYTGPGSKPKPGRGD